MRQVIVFFGDSITYFGDWENYFGDIEVYNLGVSGDRVGDLIDRMDSVYAAKPTKLFIMAGVNDLLSGRTYSETLADWDELLNECGELGCKIYVQSVLPVAENFGLEADYIPRFNEKLEQLAREHGAEYLDIYSLYADENGDLLRECTHDGLHLIRDAYRRWVRAIENKVIE